MSNHEKINEISPKLTRYVSIGILSAFSIAPMGFILCWLYCIFKFGFLGLFFGWLLSGVTALLLICVVVLGATVFDFALSIDRLQAANQTITASLRRRSN